MKFRQTGPTKWNRSIYSNNRKGISIFGPVIKVTRSAAKPWSWINHRCSFTYQCVCSCVWKAWRNQKVSTQSWLIMPGNFMTRFVTRAQAVTELPVISLHSKQIGARQKQWRRRAERQLEESRETQLMSSFQKGDLAILRCRSRTCIDPSQVGSSRAVVGQTLTQKVLMKNSGTLRNVLKTWVGQLIDWLTWPF